MKATIGSLRRLFLLALSFIGVVGIILLIWKVPQWQVNSLNIIDPKDRGTLENAARTTFVQAVGGTLLFVTAYVSWRNLVATEEKQVTERFAKAIEQLGNASIHVRLGAIYALERISNDSDKDYWQVMEILTAYVRETSPYPSQKNKSSGSLVETWFPPGSVNNSEKNAHPDNKRPIATDIQAVLTVISRRKKSYRQGKENRLDFSKSDLSRADLKGADLLGAILSGAILSGADLLGANLKGAILSGAILKGANLINANLSGANLINANLSGAYLINANFSRAILADVNLSSAYLLDANLSRAILSGTNLLGADLLGADLLGANFSGADLINVNLINVNLSGANLSRADLKGANLSGAKNLTPEQVKSANNWEQAIYDEEFRKQLGLPPESAE